MKVLLFRLLLIFVPAASFAQTAEPHIAKGSVITYDIKENGSVYKLTIKVNAFSEKDGVVLQWATTETPKRSGTSTMDYGSLTQADQLDLQLVTGKEVLEKGTVRFFAGLNMKEDMSTSHLGEFKIDGTAHSFLSIATTAQSTEVLFNGKKSTVDFVYGEDTDPDNSNIGLVNIGDDVYLMNEFSSKKITINLVSITSPAAKNQSRILHP